MYCTYFLASTGTVPNKNIGNGKNFRILSHQNKKTDSLPHRYRGNCSILNQLHWPWRCLLTCIVRSKAGRGHACPGPGPGWSWSAVHSSPPRRCCAAPPHYSPRRAGHGEGKGGSKRWRNLTEMTLWLSAITISHIWDSVGWSNQYSFIRDSDPAWNLI